MKLEDIFCTFEQSRVISGVFPNLKSIFGWFIDPSDIRENVIIPMTFVKDADKKGWVYLYPAFTTSELGVLLGRYQVVKIYDLEAGEEYWSITNLDDFLDIIWMSRDFDKKGENIVRAEAFIYLIKNKKIKVEDLKL